MNLSRKINFSMICVGKFAKPFVFNPASARQPSKTPPMAFPEGNLTSLPGELPQEALPMRNSSAKIFGDSLSHVSECRAHTEVHSPRQRRRIRQDRHVLARMIRRFPARV